MLLDFLKTTHGALTVMGVIAVSSVGVVIHRKLQIPGLDLDPIAEDLWFADRSDRRRLAIVVSMNLTNKSGSVIEITRCNLSGYSPKEDVDPVVLTDKDKEVALDFPTHERFLPGKVVQVKPYSSLKLWAYYESRSSRLSNRIDTPLVVKNDRGKRKTIRFTIPRHMEQIRIYREMMF
jgi:hypothetical protein